MVALILYGEWKVSERGRQQQQQPSEVPRGRPETVNEDSNSFLLVQSVRFWMVSSEHRVDYLLRLSTNSN